MWNGTFLFQTAYRLYNHHGPKTLNYYTKAYKEFMQINKYILITYVLVATDTTMNTTKAWTSDNL